MTQAMFFTLCSWFSRSTSLTLRGCIPAASAAHCPQLTLMVYCASPQTQWPSRDWDLGLVRGMGSGLRDLEVEPRKKEGERETAAEVQGERGVERRLQSHLESLSTQPASIQGTALWSQPLFSFIPIVQLLSLLCQLFQTYLPNHTSCPLTHFPPLSSFPPPCTIKTPILLEQTYSIT